MILLEAFQDEKRDLGPKVDYIFDLELRYGALAIKLAFDFLQLILDIDQQDAGPIDVEVEVHRCHDAGFVDND